MDGYSYDAAGNLLNDGANIYTYDAENRIIAVDSDAATFVYDADGNRVEKISPPNSEDSEVNKIFLYDQSGHPIQQFTAAFWQGHIFAGSRHLATVGGGYTVFSHSEWLGTERVRTYYNGSVCESIASLPFGDGQTTTGACYHPSPLHFTGKERDSESGLDDFGARYFGSTVGRFMSPDPPLLDQHIADPQSWNLYSYARNNPLSYIDPTGNAVELLCSGGDATKCAAERQKELEFLQKSLGNDKAASNLYINEVKDGDNTRYFVGIKGDVGDFMKMGATSHDLANLVQNKNVVEFGLTSKDLSNQGGAATYEKGEIGNQNVRVLVNPAQADVANRVLDENTVLGASRFAGQNQDPRWRVNPFTGEVMAWHEFGHAWASINGRSLDRSNPEAFQWENRMREQLYGPLGPNNARRIAH